MLTNVQTTSIKSYSEIKETGVELKQSEKVLECIGLMKMATDRMIADKLHLPCSTVAARRNKLMEEGKVVFVRADECISSGKLCRYYSLNPFPELFTEKKLSNAEKLKEIFTLCESDDSDLAHKILKLKNQ